MSPRPRKVTDDAVFAAAYRAMQRLGPDELTLGAIAAEAGVTAGALVQRFGSRRQLLARLAEAHAGSTGDFIAALRAQFPSPVRALTEYALCFAAMARTPDAMARSLAYLHNDLTDPALRRHLVAQSRSARKGVAALVRDARAAGELSAATDVDALARAVETTIGGSLMSWAIHRVGPARQWIRTDVLTTLQPYLTAAGRRRIKERT